MEAKRIRNYQTRNNEYESDCKNINKSMNKSKLINEHYNSRSKSGNKNKEPVSPLVNNFCISN